MIGAWAAISDPEVPLVLAMCLTEALAGQQKRAR